MGLMLTPVDMSDALLVAVRCLHEEAAAAIAAAGGRGGEGGGGGETAATSATAARASVGNGTGGGREGRKRRTLTSQQSLPADVFFPLLVYALVHADCPDVFSSLYMLRHFASGVENVGEKAYYITTLEAAVAHVFYWEEEEEVGEGRREKKEKKEEEEEEEEEQLSLEELGPCYTAAEHQRGLAYLDEWLASESAMEETMDILEQDGWF
eukprot:evm.model.NODE_21338_length_17281_cov_23.374863.5